MKKINCYVDGKRFATIDCDGNEMLKLSIVKYRMEDEIKDNGAISASYHIQGLIFGDYDYVNGNWVCRDRD